MLAQVPVQRRGPAAVGTDHEEVGCRCHPHSGRTSASTPRSGELVADLAEVDRIGGEHRARRAISTATSGPLITSAVPGTPQPALRGIDVDDRRDRRHIGHEVEVRDALGTGTPQHDRSALGEGTPALGGPRRSGARAATPNCRRGVDGVRDGDRIGTAVAGRVRDRFAPEELIAERRTDRRHREPGAPAGERRARSERSTRGARRSDPTAHTDRSSADRWEPRSTRRRRDRLDRRSQRRQGRDRVVAGARARAATAPGRPCSEPSSGNRSVETVDRGMLGSTQSVRVVARIEPAALGDARVAQHRQEVAGPGTELGHGRAGEVVVVDQPGRQSAGEASGTDRVVERVLVRGVVVEQRAIERPVEQWPQPVHTTRSMSPRGTSRAAARVAPGR